MAKRKRKATKRRSNRLKSKATKVTPPNNSKHDNLIVRKSNRLKETPAHEQQHVEATQQCMCHQNVHIPTRRPCRQQEVKLKTKMNCAQLSLNLHRRLGLGSCYHCDNFRADKFCFPIGTKQEDVNKRNYRCTRNEKIKVIVKYSYQYNTNVKKISKKRRIPLTLVAHKPSSTMKCRYGQWKRYRQEASKEAEVKKSNMAAIWSLFDLRMHQFEY